MLQGRLLLAKGPWVGQQTSQGTTGSASACLLLAGLLSALVTGLLHRGLLAESGYLLALWISCGGEVLFRVQGRWWVFPLPLSHLSESVPDYFSELSRAEPPESRVWACWKRGGCFSGSPVRGKCQSASRESVWNGCTLKPVSDTPSGCLCCSLLSRSYDAGWEEKKGKKVAG